MLPLEDVKVIDFSFHLPGPLASLILAEAGANVIKVERPDTGDELRLIPPFATDESISFAMLNRGKKSVSIDLKAAHAFQMLEPLLREADILVEQFRPGVMERLGFGYDAIRAINPGIVYCSITGYGQTGPNSMKAGHDLNYRAEAGLLSLTQDACGHPTMPQITIADIAGGSYPAVMNILLALRRKDRTGDGCHIDIAMSRNLFTYNIGQSEKMRSTAARPLRQAPCLPAGRRATPSIRPAMAPSSPQRRSRTVSGSGSANLSAFPTNIGAMPKIPKPPEERSPPSSPESRPTTGTACSGRTVAARK